MPADDFYGEPDRICDACATCRDVEICTCKDPMTCAFYNIPRGFRAHPEGEWFCGKCFGGEVRRIVKSQAEYMVPISQFCRECGRYFHSEMVYLLHKGFGACGGVPAGQACEVDPEDITLETVNVSMAELVSRGAA